MRGWRALTAAAAVAALLAAGAAALLVVTGSPADTTRAMRPHRFIPARVASTATGGLMARQTDGRRGLVFEIGTPQETPATGLLIVTLAPFAPSQTRELLTEERFLAACDVPGARVMTVSAGPWEDGEFSTPIFVDDERTELARAATRCRLYTVDEEGRISKAPFSSVRMR